MLSYILFWVSRLSHSWSIKTYMPKTSYNFHSQTPTHLSHLVTIKQFGCCCHSKTTVDIYMTLSKPPCFFCDCKGHSENRISLLGCAAFLRLAPLEESWCCEPLCRLLRLVFSVLLWFSLKSAQNPVSVFCYELHWPIRPLSWRSLRGSHIHCYLPPSLWDRTGIR